MYFSHCLTKTKLYYIIKQNIQRRYTMNKLINASFSGISVKVAIFVPHGKGDSIHKDRPFHGFAYFQNGTRIF